VPDRRLQRLAALRESLTAAHLDGLLLTSLPNVRYLTGFSGTNALLLVSTRDTLLITDFRYDTQVRDEVGELARIIIEPQSLWAGLWRLLPQFGGIEVLGFESAHLVHRDFVRLLDAGARWQWRPTVDVVEALRERKDPEEIALIVSAARTAERALDQTLRAVRAGMTELEVAGILEQRLRAEGSEGFPFPTIVASGERAALPHARSSGRALEKGDLLLIDFGAVVGGYCADITRTFVVGTADHEQRRMYDIVRQANERACASIRAGMTGRDADAVARSYIEDQGEGEAFGHGLGHGIGLEVHEAPRLARTAEAALPSGAVVTVEPGVYRAGWGGIRIEDDVAVTEDGVAVLTSFTHELLEIG
jgi:Xaa-Pro aminopeptidase